MAIFPFNWVEFSWGFHHGRDPMPAGLASKAKKLNPHILWFRHGLVLAFVLGTAAFESLPFSQIGLRFDAWKPDALIGVGAAAIQLILQSVFFRPGPKSHARVKLLAAEPTANWILSQLVSVLSEELWLALCVLSLFRAGHSALVAVLLPAAIFAVLHYQYGAGAIVTGAYGAISASLFLWRGSLLPSYLFHLIGNIGAFYWARHIVPRPRCDL